MTLERARAPDGEAVVESAIAMIILSGRVVVVRCLPGVISTGRHRLIRLTTAFLQCSVFDQEVMEGLGP